MRLQKISFVTETSLSDYGLKYGFSHHSFASDFFLKFKTQRFHSPVQGFAVSKTKLQSL